jgi:hypothetical protein
MFEYEKYADGSRSLFALEALILREEAGESEFLGNTVVSEDGKATNLVRFKEIRRDPMREPLRLIAGDELAPRGASAIWNGEMVVANVAQPVTAYRAPEQSLDPAAPDTRNDNDGDCE